MNKNKVKLHVFEYEIVWASIDSFLYRSRNVISIFQAPTHTRIAFSFHEIILELKFLLQNEK